MMTATPSRRTPARRPERADAVALADLCKAGADELRLRILRLLRRDAMGVSELCELLDVRQPALSHHLKLMSRAGLLDSQRDGNHIFYRRRDLPATAGGWCSVRCCRRGHLPLSVEVTQRRRRCSTPRENSREFFRTTPSASASSRTSSPHPERYAEPWLAALDALPASGAPGVGDRPRRRLAASGTGQRYAKVVALDNAAEMLARLGGALQAGIDNVTLLGDTGSPALRGLDADLVVINMVLHHTPDPARPCARPRRR
jgi:DNA-binding transcriptional ArsR family regulator